MRVNNVPFLAFETRQTDPYMNDFRKIADGEGSLQKKIVFGGILAQ